jgi:hypothetical protein
MNNMESFIQSLQAQISELQNEIRSTRQSRLTDIDLASTNLAPTSPRLSLPMNFSGDRKETAPFLLQCELHFDASPRQFPDTKSQVNFAVSFLRGDAMTWYSDTIYKPKITFQHYSDFSQLLLRTFGASTSQTQDQVYFSLQNLTQTKSCHDYSTKFSRLASRLQTDDNVKMILYRAGLKSVVRNHIIGLSPAPITLHDLMEAAVKFDDSYFANTVFENKNTSTRFKERAPFIKPYTSPTTSDRPTVAMEIDSQVIQQNYGHITDSERKRRTENHLCMYCGEDKCSGSSDVTLCPKLAKRNASGNAHSRAAPRK